MDDESPLQKAVRLAGGQAALARKLDPSVKQQHVWKWLRTQVPAEHCPDIEQATGVTCEALRPDVAWHVVRAKPTSKPERAV